MEPGRASRSTTEKRAIPDNNREERIRRMAAQQGLVLGKSERHSDEAGAGGYLLFDSPDFAVAVFVGIDPRGPLDVSGRGCEATLDEIEAFLTRGEGRGKREGD